MLTALTAIVFLAADTPDIAKKDLKKLQGTWIMAALEVNGEKVPEEKLGAKLVVDGDKYTVHTKTRSYETVITLEPTKKPKAIDMVFRDGPNRDRVHQGIYQIDGDTWKLCRALDPDSERPSEFATEPGTGLFLIVWKRDPSVP